MDYSHLVDESVSEVTETDTLKRLEKLAELYTETKLIVEKKEAELKKAKKNFNKISQELIPEAMMSVNMAAIELQDGRMLRVKQELSASVKDYNKLVKFLEDRGDDSIVKTSLELGKLPQNIVNRIMRDFSETYDLFPDVKTSVHHKTLSSYLSKLCGIKKGSKAELPLGALDKDMVNAYTYYKTVVK